MVRIALYLIIPFVIISILSVLNPNQVFAQTVCQNTSRCTAQQSTVIKEYNLDADGNPECEDKRQFYLCGGTRCFQDSTTCTEQIGVCNNGAGNRPNDRYTCNNYCNDLAVPAHCGNYPASDPRPTCSVYIQECLNQYCRPVNGTSYTCPSSQECISPPDPKAHQCITPITSPLPGCSLTVDSSSVSSGDSTTLRWTTTSSPSTCTTSGEWFGNKNTSGGSENTGTLTNTTSSDISKGYFLTCYTPSGTAGPSCSATVTVGPEGCSPADCSCATNCGSCIIKNSCGWNGSSCVSGTRAGPGNNAACLPDNWYWTSCRNNQAAQCPQVAVLPVLDCSITKLSTTPSSVSLRVAALGFTDNETARFDWFLDSQTNFLGTNRLSDQPATFSGFVPNSTHTIYTQAWSTTDSPQPTRLCQIQFTTSNIPARYKCVNNTCQRDDNATGSYYPTSSCNGACAPAPPPITTCNCNADEPSCNETTRGVCLGTNPLIACTKNGPACVDDARIVLNFYNEDCVTPYSGVGTIKLLEDDQNGDSHNDLFYGNNGQTSHNTNQGGACDKGQYHPYLDPGYQINSDGSLSGCPSYNLDNCCQGPEGSCSEVEGYSCTPEGFSDSCTAGAEYECRGGAYMCGTCHVNKSNDICLGAGSTPNEPTAFPRCFSPASGIHQDITPSNPSFTYSASYFNLGQTNQTAPRDQRRAYSIGVPSGYQLKVNKLCTSDYDGGCNAVILGQKNQGRTVKDFSQPIVGSLTNYFATSFEGVNGNTSILAYDVCVKVPTVTLSGVVFNDKDWNKVRNTNQDTSDYEEGLPNATVTITQVANPANPQASYTSSPTDSGGSYSFTLSAGRYTLTFTPSQGYQPTTTIPVSLTLNSDTQKDLGAATVYTISGNVRNDDNGDGICLPQESVLPNAQVRLTNGPTQKPNTQTSGLGSYNFNNLKSGTYTISVNPPLNKRPPAPQSKTLGPDSLGVDFCIFNIPPWLQTVGGDIHSNTSVKLPSGPR